MPNQPSDGTAAAHGNPRGTPTWPNSPHKPNARAEQELLIQKAYADQLMDVAPEAIVVMDHEMRVLRVNPEFIRTFGYASEEAEGQLLDDLIVPAGKKEEGHKVGQAVLAGNKVEMESERCRKDGSLLQASVLVTPVTVAGGQVGFYAIYRDITERKRSERLQAALYRIAETASSASDLEELYATIHRIVAELMYARNLYVAIQDPVTGTVSFPYWMDERDPAPAPRKGARGLTEYVLRTGKPLMVTPESYAEMAERGEIEVIGTVRRTWIGIPLKSGERTFGVLAVGAQQHTHRFGQNEASILSFVSQQVASAIQFKHQQQEIRESESKFRAVAEMAPCSIFI